MTDNEIFARIARDVAEVENSMFCKRSGITIWMTIDLFNRLAPKEFYLTKDSAMTNLFGCRVRIVFLPGDEMRWIVGFEGTVQEG